MCKYSYWLEKDFKEILCQKIWAKEKKSNFLDSHNSSNNFQRISEIEKPSIPTRFGLNANNPFELVQYSSQLPIHERRTPKSRQFYEFIQTKNRRITKRYNPSLCADFQLIKNYILPFTIEPTFIDSWNI